MHEAVALRALALVEAGEYAVFGRADPDTVLPAAPPGRRTERRVVIPGEPGEPRRPGPRPGGAVHPRGDLAEFLEVSAGQRAPWFSPGLGAGQELKAHAVPFPAAGFWHRHHPLPVGGG